MSLVWRPQILAETVLQVQCSRGNGKGRFTNNVEEDRKRSEALETSEHQR